MDKEKNFRQRIEFIKYWVNYMKKTNNKNWSRQQNVLINSILKSSDQNKERYLKIKDLMKNADNKCK